MHYFEYLKIFTSTITVKRIDVRLAEANITHILSILGVAQSNVFVPLRNMVSEFNNYYLCQCWCRREL